MMTKKDSISISGTVQAYLLNRSGDIDGLLLFDGKQLHLPPHCGTALQQAVKPGDTIEALVEPGKESPLGEEFRTQRLTNTQTGKIVADQSSPSASLPEQPLQVEGSIAYWLVGHKGEPKGFILSDGTYLHVPPHIGKTLTERVKQGDRIVAQGYGTRNDIGTSLNVEAIELNGQQLLDMNNFGTPQHKQAADHYEEAAHHHRKAAKHLEAGEPEKAAHHARLAHEHHLQATQYWEAAGKQYSNDKAA
ncbi:MAG: hypothetical protein JOZ78_09960 [Chroococcidiopsidaceae cyanobacterium CP_BM_ER_R8_30]|nr:hypothetical protein [Chroococcidiopsidaceae cyanobacterium CP_BM_ER_R8_30]